ncbi:MAG: 1,4-alpha-glucan branching protein GlgB [Geminicoccaceae bacterium]
MTDAPPWSLPEGEIEALAQGVHGNPFAVLGMHHTGDALIVRALVPGADKVTVIEHGEAIAALQRLHVDGVFAGAIPERNSLFAYHLEAVRGDERWQVDDAYRFGPVLGEMDEYLFAEGSHQRLWERLGAHPMVHEGISGCHFAVWAPSARRVAVVGEFNYWDGRRHGMRPRGSTGIWEMFLPGIEPGVVYKYQIHGADGRLLPLKADPMGFAAELRPKTASKVADLDSLPGPDSYWRARRAAAQDVHAPISIYEVHLGSWRRHEDGGFLSYRELAEQLVPYVADLGFSHIELLPVSEHPFDGSWGYQPIGLFAPTARHGTPEDFAAFIKACHEADLGVILDWVPGHFPTDEHGLANFDGTHLYEHADPRQGFHRDWNTLIFNYGRTEVVNFLVANALFWFERYGIDGLRVDAVASMLYLDYSREADDWIPNRHGGNENLEAIDFLRRTNALAYGQHPGIMMVAEESTAWPGVSRPVHLGGLGFGYKWNMGWMHDTLDYMSRDPLHRRYHHHQMTFGLLYGFSENFILPLSHDEVVHGKGSLLSRMPGDAWQQFANLRAYFAFMWTHPGKKLLFMGGEFAQGREWDADAALDWHLLEVDWHQGVQRLIRELNQLYRNLPALHVYDCDPRGFAWIEANAGEDSVYAYLRQGGEGDPPVLVVCNFTPVPRQRYKLGLPVGGRWLERLNTDAEAYRGSGWGNLGGIEAKEEAWHDWPYSIELTLPPLSTLVLVRG